MSTLILIRHGQAAFGADNYDQLTGLGRAQAAATGRWLQRYRGKSLTLLHGPRQRHIETAREILRAAQLMLDPQQQAELDEFGEGEEILSAAEQLCGHPLLGPDAPQRRVQLQQYDRAISAWTEGRLDFPGRLSYAEFRRAAAGWLRGLTTDPGLPGGSRIVAVTSAGVICAAVCEVLGLASTAWHPLLRGLQNASITEIAFTTGRCGLRSFNAAGHLPAELESGI
ncbi:MAG: histidine phosphatase family protein [Rhodocyclaceae bacterium]|nr:histidine phosphatase family protein [Rhodocyclaceae bacterium]MBX3668771.1 histidine phosphatase family protein [Rhodocyclaceae bacterium]